MKQGHAHADLAQETFQRSQFQQALDCGSARHARRRRAGGDRAALCRRAVFLGPPPPQEMPAAPALSRRAGVVLTPQQGRVPDIFHGGAQYQVMLGGPRRVAPVNHVEWSMRRTPLSLWFG
jgi:hypothetical protein